MAKKLRFRFILISMLSLLTVLVAIMVVVNVTNYAEVTNNADNLLYALQTGGGRFNAWEAPPEKENGTQPDQEAAPDWRRQDDRFARFSAETPFETRYFSVFVLDDGSYVADVNNVAAVDAAEAEQLAQKVLASGKTKGYQGQYRYLVANEGKLVLFVDCNRALDTANNFLRTSLIVSAAALLGTFVLVFLFSRRAVKPTVEAYERQRQFVTEASHELKTPITIISANNELLQLEYGENESSDAIDKQVKRLSAMVKNLVSLSRLDEAEHIEKGHVDLSGCVAEHVDLYANALTANGRTLETDVAADVSVEGNVDLLAQLTSILLDNAIKYAATFTKVELKKDKAVCLTVQNDAADLADGDKSRCFERFYRDADVSKNIEGSGIGLAIAKQIVTLHHGTISANAKDGVFTICVTL